MKVYVELPQSLDVAEWRRRNARGLAPDATPYGLHRLADLQTTVVFRRSWPGQFTQPLRVLKSRSHGYEVLPALVSRLSPLRRSADVVLTMDERTGLPAALLGGGPPVVTGVAWLTSTREAWPGASALTKRALARVAGVFTECPAMVNTLVEEMGVPREKVYFVRFGVDEKFFSPRPWSEAIPGRVFSVGDDRFRDHDTLVAAMVDLQSALPHATLELATTLPVQVPQGLGIVHRRRMDEAVRGCYSRASVVAVALHPTRVGSGLSVMTEAMASGRPVVASANPGLNAYVEHGVTGLLVPPGDTRAFRDAVASLLEDPDRARAMGQAGQRRVHEQFTSADFAADLRGVLQDVVHRTPRVATA
ncbi:glycosyltransferase family 4 protein [Gephyromycinifex aptenodytis]|uniref:glycosyltransferase family 4 protein n=1 Tax=Gephyromycinifex aptenodytis TaxID=2716227 RepID=UPI0014486CA8|nr:glycosyltransferase family 4 protein [Gephyromycinifex aptenodytis]